MSSEGEAKLERAIVPVCAEMGVEVIDVEFRPGVVAVTVDRPGGLDLDAIAEASRAVSAVLDANEDLGPAGHYELEVSSPGLERRLRRPEHFRAVLGQSVAIRTVAGVPGERRISGSIAAVLPDAVEIALEGTEMKRLVSYGEIERARTVVDWQAALREGKERIRRDKVATS